MAAGEGVQDVPQPGHGLKRRGRPKPGPGIDLELGQSRVGSGGDLEILAAGAQGAGIVVAQQHAVGTGPHGHLDRFQAECH